MSPEVEVSRRNRKKRETRDRIYEAALELLSSRAYGEVTVEEICDRAEVGRATFFRFYGSKAGLLVEFNDRILYRLRDRLAELSGEPAIDRLWAVQEEISRAWSASSAATREMAREWIRTSTALELSEGGRTSQLVQLVAAIVAEGQRDGELSDRFTPTFCACMIVSALQGAIAVWLGHDGGKPVDAGHDVIEFLLDGFRQS